MVMSIRKLSFTLFCLVSVLLCAFPAIAGTPAHSPNAPSLETVLHSFNGADGAMPYSGLFLASDGKYYGTTIGGNGGGTIYSIDTAGNFTLIYSFPGGAAGAAPYGSLIQLSNGTFYGTTALGGTSNSGTIFEMVPGNNPVVLHSFNGSTDGAQPFGGMYLAVDGFLYGNTSTGGPNGAGTTFRMATDGSQFTVLHSFPAFAGDGANPQAAMTQGADGFLYATTLNGGTYNQGAIFKMDTSGSVTILHNLNGTTDGGHPYSVLVQADQNNFFGTCSTGGKGAGLLFKIDWKLIYSIKWKFNAQTEGSTPISGISFGGNGSLFGVLSTGGTAGGGALYATDQYGMLTVIQPFSAAGGFTPTGIPLQAPDSSIYGTAQMGGANSDGVVYRVVPGSANPRWGALGPMAIQLPDSPAAAGKLQALVVQNQNSQVMLTGGGVGPGNSGPYTQTGIYKTVNGGATWTPANTGLTDHVINTLWLDQNNPNTVLAGTNTGGVFQSTDAGAHWTATAAGGSVSAFVQIGSTVYGAASVGIGKSNDDGATWTLVKSTSSPARALATGAGALYAGLDNGNVLIKLTATSPWKTATPANGTVWSIAVNPTNANNAFVVEWNNSQSPDLYATTDGGSSWSAVSSLTCPAQVVAYSAVTSTLYAGCNGALFQSTNNGSSWSQITGAIWDFRMLIPDFAGVSGNIAVGSDQGIFLGVNQGATWQSLNSNITTNILYGIGSRGNRLFTTAEGFDSIISHDGGDTWSSQIFANSPQGQGGTVLINPGNESYVYYYTNAGFQISSDRGNDYSPVASLPASEFPAYAGNGNIIAPDIQSPARVYAVGVDGIFKSTTFGAKFALQSWPITTPVMVSVDPSNSNTIFVGQQNGQLAITHDGGNTWTTANLGCANCGAPTALAVDPTNSLNVLVGMSQPPPKGGILFSNDGGATFAPSNTGIVSAPSLCAAAITRIRFDPSGSGVIAASTNNGLYTSADEGQTWSNIQGPVVPTAFTDVLWSLGDLYATTCGEGLVRTPFAQ
jgi:uncharacterized repeat protein (TIGR03803 family)